jgi:hypothetical protein
MDLRERAAQASGRYTDDEWAKLASSDDPLDQCTVTNARAVAANILDLPEIKEALQTKAEIDESVRGGGYSLHASKYWSERIALALAATSNA